MAHHLELNAEMITIAQFKVQEKGILESLEVSFDVGFVMNMNERQIALSVCESLREDLTYARLNNGSRILDVADLRQYLYEQMSRIRTNAYITEGLFGNGNGHGPDNIHRNGHSGKAHL